MADLKRQHYVTRAYLAFWAPDGLLWLKRGSSTYSTDPTNVAVKSWCYEVSALNETERDILEDFLSKGDSKLGDGDPWKPAITVSGGDAAFYSIDVSK